MDYPIHNFGGSGPVLNFAVANGITPETYVPLLRFLIPHYRVMCLPPRALWQGEKPPAQILDWRESVARDLLDGLRAHDLHEVIAVGHSFGGIASLLSVLSEPRRFKALILLDPTILEQHILDLIDGGRAAGMSDQVPLAVRTLKRQRDFESPDAALQYFKGKSLFAGWNDEALRLYAEQGTRPAENGVTLRWTPEWEAYYFNAIYTGIWKELPRLRDLNIPLLIVRGAESDTFVEESAQKVCSILPAATYAEIPGHGHLFPQTAPEKTAEILLDWLRTKKIVRA